MSDGGYMTGGDPTIDPVVPAIDPTTIAERAAARLNVPVTALVGPATAALEYIAADISTTVDLLPAGYLLEHGAMLLTERIYLDTPTPGGELDALGSAVFAGVSVPVNLGTHLRDYWSPAQHSWGVA